jgi:hypothetical protein
VKSLDSFDFTAIPLLNKTLVLELARCEYIARRENAIRVKTLDGELGAIFKRWHPDMDIAVEEMPVTA